jgi:hypothetical protein
MAVQGRWVSLEKGLAQNQCYLRRVLSQLKIAVFGGHTVEQLLANFAECVSVISVCVVSRLRPLGQSENTSNSIKHSIQHLVGKASAVINFLALRAS